MTVPLNESELAAYKKYPDTFFGGYRPKGGTVQSPLEMYDFLLEAYRNTPREKLLGFLRGHPMYEQLSKAAQEELVVTYCEELVNSIGPPERLNTAK